MTVLLILGAIVLLPFILKVGVVYLAYFQWALQVKPVQLYLNFGKTSEKLSKKKQIGFPVEIPSTIIPVSGKNKTSR